MPKKKRASGQQTPRKSRKHFRCQRECKCRGREYHYASNYHWLERGGDQAVIRWTLYGD